MNFILASDTSCDIYRNEMTERGIEYKPLVYSIEDVPYEDRFSKDEEYKGFYSEIRAGKRATTSQINVAEHEEFFEELIAKYNKEIVYITLSSALSCSYASACTAAKTVTEKTGVKIFVVDSIGATVAQRHIVDEGERLRDAGISAADAAEKLADYTNHIHTWFMPYDLMHLKRGGRVSGPAAYIGTALNIKPVLYINKIGGLSVVQKIIGVSKAINYMVNNFKRDASKEPHRVYIPTADSEYVEEIVSRAKAIRPDCEFVPGWIGPVIGAHTGANAVGISFRSEKIREI